MSFRSVQAVCLSVCLNLDGRTETRPNVGAVHPTDRPSGERRNYGADLVRKDQAGKEQRRSVAFGGFSSHL